MMNTFQFSNMIHHKTKYSKKICEMITNYIYNTKAIEDVPFKICDDSPKKINIIETEDIAINLQTKYKKYYFVEIYDSDVSKTKFYIFRSINKICEWIAEINNSYNTQLNLNYESPTFVTTKYSFTLEKSNDYLTHFWCRIIYKNKSDKRLLIDKLGNLE